MLNEILEIEKKNLSADKMRSIVYKLAMAAAAGSTAAGAGGKVYKIIYGNTQN